MSLDYITLQSIIMTCGGPHVLEVEWVWLDLARLQSKQRRQHFGNAHDLVMTKIWQGKMGV